MTGEHQVPIAAYEHQGIWVNHARRTGESDSLPPLVFVHGGALTSQCWQQYLSFFDGRGWECLSFDWFHHGRSKRLDSQVFLTRGVWEVATEIGLVASLADRPPVLIGHSWGAGASLSYAAAGNAVAALVLLSPPTPTEPNPRDRPSSAVADAAARHLVAVAEDKPMPPISIQFAKQLLFTDPDSSNMDDIGPIGDESPQVVLGRERWASQVDFTAISAPTLIITGSDDVISPPRPAEEFASELGADYLTVDNAAHGDVLLRQSVATSIHDWLTAIL